MYYREFQRGGDFLHAYAVLFLIVYIIIKRSCHSVSGLTMILYTITFSCRYLDLYPFYSDLPKFQLIYITVGKIYFLLSSYLILFLIYGLHRKTRDKSGDTFPVVFLLVCAQILTWITCYFNNELQLNTNVFWRFSIYLEIVAMIPQFSLIYKQGTIDKVMTFYLLMLGSYRVFYVIHWICRYNIEHCWQPITFVSACTQTIIYVIFFVCIYPRLNNQTKCQSVEVTKDFIKIVDIKENINEKGIYDEPLIHHV
jgi:ER lumen protein retaining receptor